MRHPPRVGLGRTPPSRHVAVALLLLGALSWVAITLLLVVLGWVTLTLLPLLTVFGWLLLLLKRCLVGTACHRHGRGHDTSLSSSIQICVVVGHQVLSIGSRCGGSAYLPLDISEGGFSTRTEDENEPQNIMVHFVTHRVGSLPFFSSSSSTLLVVSSAFLVVVSPSRFARRQPLRKRATTSVVARVS